MDISNHQGALRPLARRNVLGLLLLGAAAPLLSACAASCDAKAGAEGNDCRARMAERSAAARQSMIGVGR
ncbi:MAG: hypothetical protein AAFY02_07880 [Pseudomonadota bacterium]